MSLPVNFDADSAARIYRAVRTVERGNRDQKPLTFRRASDESRQKTVRAATFSGSWPTGSSKVVTFAYAPTATVSVTNLLWPLTATAYANEPCLVAREGTSWWLVAPRTETATAVFVTQTATALFVTQTAKTDCITGVSTSGSTINFLSDVSVSATLNTTDCSISVSVTKSSGSASVITAVNTSTASFVTISSSATGVYIAQHFTSSYLRLRVP